MKKFREWFKDKVFIHNFKQRPFCKEREIWFASFGVNVGFEQDGQGSESLRPVIILKKFNNEITWVVPLTKSAKPLNVVTGRYYFDLGLKGVKNRAILSQMKLIDTKRLQYKVGDMIELEFKEIKRKITRLLE